jgi:DNA-binding response OmpR family regulator
MKDYLNDIGYSVHVTNEYDVFIQVRRFQPDIVIVNLIMKDTTGDKLIEYIKSTNPGIICFLSSCDLIKLEDFIEQKVDEVINTPVNKIKLSEILNKSLSRTGNVNDDVTRQRVDRPFNKLRNKSNEYVDVDILSKTGTGEKNSDFSFCPYCGQKLVVADKGFLFCPHCGQRLKN